MKRSLEKLRAQKKRLAAVKQDELREIVIAQEIMMLRREIIAMGEEPVA